MSITTGNGTSGLISSGSGNSITNKLILDNYSEISDLIILNNSNLNEYSNITVNFDNKYRLGIIDNNFNISKNNEFISDNDYVLKVTDDDIIIYNSNIVNNIHNNFIINHNDENILHIEQDNCNFNISNYNLNYFIKNNEFNIYDTNTDDIKTIFGVSSNRININCDLIVNTIFTKNIESIDDTGITIGTYHIEENNFKKISVGYDTYFTTETNDPDTPFIIVNNSSNYNISNLFEIKKIYDNTSNIDKIFKIDNNGYIYG